MQPTIFLEYELKTFDELKFTREYEKSLQGYLEKIKDESLQNIFTFTSKGIKARNYVGILRYKNYQFEILPKLIDKEKIESKEEQETILKNLLYMLSLTKKLDILEEAGADIDVSIMLYPNSRKTWESVDARLSGKVFDLVDKALSERNMQLLSFDHMKPDQTAAGFDAYYGSPSPLVPAFVVKHRPVMLADYGI